MQSPAIKNPTVLAGIFDPRGLIEILVSPPSSGLTSRASSNSLSFTKQSLKVSLGSRIYVILTLQPGWRTCQWRWVRESRCTSRNRSLGCSRSANQSSRGSKNLPLSSTLAIPIWQWLFLQQTSFKCRKFIKLLCNWNIENFFIVYSLFLIYELENTIFSLIFL